MDVLEAEVAINGSESRSRHWLWVWVGILDDGEEKSHRIIEDGIRMSYKGKFGIR